jgi:hypothetical protein
LSAGLDGISTLATPLAQEYARERRYHKTGNSERSATAGKEPDIESGYEGSNSEPKGKLTPKRASEPVGANGAIRIAPPSAQVVVDCDEGADQRPPNEPSERRPPPRHAKWKMQGKRCNRCERGIEQPPPHDVQRSVS